MSTSLPTRTLRENPDLDQLKRQAKELLEGFRSNDPAAAAEVRTHYRGAAADAFALHDAQLVLARAYGFPSWPKLKAYVDGVTVKRLVDAIVSGDLARVQAMLQVRPELAKMNLSEGDEHQPLHFAVFSRNVEITRLLMRRGADARSGIYPHRDATTALMLAEDRGYDDIAAALHEEESRRGQTLRRDDGASPMPPGVMEALARGDQAELDHGATLSPRGAVLLNKTEWLRERHAAGRLENPVGEEGGLLSVAVQNNLPEMLELLLDLGLDPDERVRLENLEETVYSAGGPLHHCAATGKLAMAEMLLKHGADPNCHVYAAGPPLYKAYENRNLPMVELLERYGGVVDASTAGILGLTEKARRLLADDEAGTLKAGTHAPHWSVAEELLFYAADGGNGDIVRMALSRIPWEPADPRWHQMLVRNLGNHPEPARRRHAECFGLILDRCDPGVPGTFGRTILHDLAADWPHPSPVPEERVEFARLVLAKNPRLDVRDHLLKSTPLGWACRWGRVELVQLLLECGADPIESEAEPWATPRAWAEKRNHRAIRDLLT